MKHKCDGHPAGPNDPMGETVYCDGSCKLTPAQLAQRSALAGRLVEQLRAEFAEKDKEPK